MFDHQTLSRQRADLTLGLAVALMLVTTGYHTLLMTLVWDELWFDRIAQQMISHDGWLAPLKAANHLGYGSLFWSLVSLLKLVSQAVGLSQQASLHLTMGVFGFMLSSPYWLMHRLAKGHLLKFSLLAGLWATTLMATWYGKIISADSLLVLLTVYYADCVAREKQQELKVWLFLGLMTGLKPYAILLGIFLLPNTYSSFRDYLSQLGQWIRSLRWQNLTGLIAGLALSSMGWWVNHDFVVLDNGRALGFAFRDEIGFDALVNVVANPAKYMLDGPVSAGFIHAVWSSAVVALLIYVNWRTNGLYLAKLVLVFLVSAVVFSLGVKYYAWYWYPLQVMSLLLLARQQNRLLAICLVLNLLNNMQHIGYQFKEKKLDLLAQQNQQLDYERSRKWLKTVLPTGQVPDTVHYYDAFYNHLRGYHDQDYWTCIRPLEDSIRLARFNKPYLAMIISVRNVMNMRAMVKQYHLSYPIRSRLKGYEFVADQNLVQGGVYLYRRRQPDDCDKL